MNFGHIIFFIVLGYVAKGAMHASAPPPEVKSPGDPVGRTFKAAVKGVSKAFGYDPDGEDDEERRW